MVWHVATYQKAFIYPSDVRALLDESLVFDYVIIMNYGPDSVFYGDGTNPSVGLMNPRSVLSMQHLDLSKLFFSSFSTAVGAIVFATCTWDDGK